LDIKKYPNTDWLGDALVMSRNRFDSLLAFLHIVDKNTEEELKKENDKVAKVGIHFMYFAW